MIALAKQNCPSATFNTMDCRDISSLEQRFDAMVCGFCLPYLNMDEIKKLVSDAADLLVTNGILYISAIEKDHQESGYQKSSNGEDSCMIYYYKEKDLHPILKSCDFTESHIFRKDFDTDIHLVMIAQKK
jgi:chemotaxis methyl-accepting protein methylase